MSNVAARTEPTVLRAAAPRRTASPVLFVPARRPKDWKRLLADPDTQWKRGRSARTLAHAWHEAAGLPVEVRDALATTFPSVELLLAIPERQVALPGGGHASQNDVWALCRTDTGLLSLTIEGKVAESLGPTIGEWSKHASPGRQERLTFLCNRLGLQSPPPETVRYQLLHRTVSAMLEAERFCAAHAVMLVQTFDPQDRGFEDFAAFGRIFGVTPEKGRLHAAPTGAPSTLHIGWVHGEERFRKL